MKRSYDSTGISMEGNYPVAPEGIYDLLIININDMKDGVQRKTKNGDDYISVESEIQNVGEYTGIKVWHGVTIMEDRTRKGAGMAIHFIKTIGQPWEGKFDIDTDQWIGKTFRAKLNVTKDNKGRPKNEIAYLVSEDEDNDSSIPF